jgi:hypothetical protein
MLGWPTELTEIAELTTYWLEDVNCTGKFI